MNKLTWEQALPIYLNSLEFGNREQKRLAREEIMRLGLAVDKQNK